jgi:hypothetical protein
MKHFLLALLLVPGLACQSHFSTQEAYDICLEDQQRNPSAFLPESFDDCVACYETCGSDCTGSGSPIDYVCPE